MPPKDQDPNHALNVIAYSFLGAAILWLIIYISYKLTRIFWSWLS